MRKPFFIVISAPSGTGKTTVCKEILQKNPSISLSVSMTTRPPRKTETHEKDYYFVSHEEFQKHIEEKNFLEHEKVFDHLYGTPISFLKHAMKQGKDVLLDIDWKGANTIKNLYPDSVVSIFLLPPSLESLRHRLITRNQDTDDIIERRLAEAQKEIESGMNHTYTIVNNRVEDTVASIEHILHAENLKSHRNDFLLEKFFPSQNYKNS